MNILIFKTVNEERTKRLLNSIDLLNHNVYIIMPESEISHYRETADNIYYIGTGEKYIDYNTLMKENRIPNIKFHEIWVPSPQISSIYTYWEAYTVISELKYSKVYYKVVNSGEIITYDLKQENIFSRIYGLMVRTIRIYTDLFYLIEKRVKGYK